MPFLVDGAAPSASNHEEQQVPIAFICKCCCVVRADLSYHIQIRVVERGGCESHEPFTKKLKVDALVESDLPPLQGSTRGHLHNYPACEVRIDARTLVAVVAAFPLAGLARLNGE